MDPQRPGGYDEAGGAGDSASEELTISAGTECQLLGSHSGVAELRRRRGGGVPEWTDPPPFDPPPPPPPSVSVPDIGIQIRDPRGTDPPCATAEERAKLVTAIRDAITPRFPNAEVRATCFPVGEPAKNAEAFGIWTRPLVRGTDDAARNAGLAALRLLEGPEAFGSFINAGLIRQLADDAFQATPKRLNADGDPDSDGSVHLQNMQVLFEPPDRVVTQISGYDERPWPDVGFTIKIEDVMSAADFGLACRSRESIDTHGSWVHVISAAVLAIVSTFNPWLLPLFVIATYQAVQVLSAEPPEQGGVGRSALQFFPGEMPVEGGQKLVFLYQRLDVRSGGLFAAGTYLPTPRRPSVRLAGAVPLVGDVNAGSAKGVFRAVHEDFRNPTFAWGGGAPSQPGRESTTITFDIGNTPAGRTVVRQLSVRVTDADGLTAEATMTVQIRVVDMEDETIPPHCRAKPWLCEETPG